MSLVYHMIISMDKITAALDFFVIEVTQMSISHGEEEFSWACSNFLFLKDLTKNGQYLLNFEISATESTGSLIIHVNFNC